MSFEGKIVLVTGAASGIGLAVAKEFSSQGAKVWAADICKESEDLVGINNIVYRTLDVTDISSWEALVESIRAADGTLDILVNCAGRIDYGLIADTPWETISKAMDVNLGGTYRSIQACAPLMTKNDENAPWTSIINISSMASYGGVPFFASYAASKSALTSLTKTAAQELSGQRIRVNSVHPGAIDTPMADKTHEALAPLAGGDKNIIRQGVVSRHLVGRMGTVDDVVYGVLYLADDRASFTTGYDLKVSGGRET